MLQAYRQLWQLLNRRERRQGVLLLLLVLIMGLVQMGGVASVMPFMAVAADPAAIDHNPYLALAYQWLAFTDPEQFLFLLGLLVFAAVTMAIAFQALTAYATVRYSRMRQYNLSRRLVAGYLARPYEWFLNRHSADLGKSILSEVEQVVGQAVQPAIHLLSDFAVAIAIGVLLILIDPLLALGLTLGVGGTYSLIYLALRRRMRRIGAERVRVNQRRFQVVQEAFGSIKDVKVAGLEGPMLHRFDGPAYRFASIQAQQMLAAQMPRYALEGIAFGGLLMVVLYLLRLPGGMERAIPELAVYAFGAYRLMPAVQGLYSRLVTLRFAGPAVANLHRDLCELAPPGPTALPLERPAPLGLREAIELDGITYRYPSSERPAIQDLHLRIPAHSSVGLVGRTGSGKTTLVDIILGLLQPQDGQLCVDGQPIDAERVRAWQASIGYVPQFIYLADASISANIAFGLNEGDIDQAAVERAARIANLHEFVSELPQGYATAVGERGVRLSGGQRQRVGIARALYHDPQLLILDEATSALDNLTEQAVMEAVNNLGRRKTIVMIAHRLSTVRACDQIVHLEQGEIIGQGSYDDLTQRSERFRGMAAAAGG